MLIADASDEKSLAYAAAGPLEDLLHKHGDVVIDRVELHARTDPKFRLALTGVGGRGVVFDRLRRAIGGGSNFRWSGTRRDKV
jgi:hypothetical protein